MDSFRPCRLARLRRSATAAGARGLKDEPFERPQPHSDAAARACEASLAEHFRKRNAVADAVWHAQLAERSVERRFKAATGLTLIDYRQNLRIAEAKRLLESSD